MVLQPSWIVGFAVAVAVAVAVAAGYPAWFLGTSKIACERRIKRISFVGL